MQIILKARDSVCPMHYKTHCFVNTVLHCIVFYDVNLTISPLDSPITTEFTKGFP